MAKARSPQYPAIGLKEAVEKIRQIYDQDYQNPIPREVAAKHMGYTGLNGKSLGVLSALSKYGLLEGRGDDTRVSAMAVAIIAHPPGADERVVALRDAASRPELFSELDNRFQGGKASDQAIRSYLMTQKFIPSAADAVVRSYRETKQLVDSEVVGYPNAAIALAEEPMPDASFVRVPTAPAPLPPMVLSEGEPYRLTMGTRSGLEVFARLQNEVDADALIRALTTWKILLRPVDAIKKPDESSGE